MNDYELRQEAKRERMLARADKLDGVAARGRKTFENIHSFIPFGQPILVGHHSEKRHRRDLDKANRAMQMSFDAQKLAGELRARASGIGSNGISSDDPDAPHKIKERIAELEAIQTKMGVANKLLRKGNEAGLLAMGFTQAQIDKLKVPAWGNGRGPIGFEPFQLSNNSANIRRLKKRLAHVEGMAKWVHMETPLGNSGVVMVDNVEINRLQLKFPGKPDAEVRTKLKRNGFRWSPTEGAWQRQLSNGAKYAAREIVNGL
jgi:hypothetical protein